MRIRQHYFATTITLALSCTTGSTPGFAERATTTSSATSPVAGDLQRGDGQRGDVQSDIVHFAGGRIQVQFNPADFALSRDELHDWVRDSARATAAYFGRFPVPFVRLVLDPIRGSQVTMGRAVGRPEPRIVVTMGRRTTADELKLESLLVHEMVHLAIPDHDIRYLWLHEGIATYVENVARTQAGLTTPEAMWNELMREIPEGMPEPRETGGLDGTRSDRRRYWGGALFCLIADIEIRKSTGNKQGLQDALRALQKQGGNLSRMWTLERTIEVADRNTGSPVMAALYKTMGPRPHAPDLAQLWRDLGIRSERGRIVTTDTAPLAAIRRAITDRPSAPLLIGAPRIVRIANYRAAAVRP